MKLGDRLPQPAVVLIMALCGALGGGLYGMFVAALKVKWGTNETLLTLMLNYVALYFLQFFAETKAPWNFSWTPSPPGPSSPSSRRAPRCSPFPSGPFI